jgi:tetratricopeptide (TPR) repeat protein
VTATATLRLAELYYERAADTRRRAVLEKGDGAPAVDHGPSITLYRRILEEFPGYERLDAVYYLLGYAREEQGDRAGALSAYQTLLSRFPQSRFATEAHVRQGEWAFEEDPAAAARSFELAIRDRTHPLYDKALYKLGWAYFRLDRYDEAVSRFLTLLDHYAREGKGAGDLREEALQYTAISFADERWGSVAKAKATFAELGQKPYAPELYRRLGEALIAQGRPVDGALALKLALEAGPLSPEAPATWDALSQVLIRDGKHDEAFAAIEGLAELALPGSAWSEHHRPEPERRRAALALAEKSLAAAAAYHHRTAQLRRDAKDEAGSRASFDRAARAYRRSLELFPSSANAAEIEFFLAECLFSAGGHLEAAKRYDAVRDRTTGPRQREAAFGAVAGYQRLLGGGPPVRLSAQRPAKEAPAPSPYAEVESAFIAAAGAYVRLFPDDERSPPIGYRAAELHFAHDDFPRARSAFEALVRAYPAHEVARFSANLLVETYLIPQDWEGVERVTSSLLEHPSLVKANPALAQTLQGLKLSARFKRAGELVSKGELEAAAGRYLALADEAPGHELADDALNNAAVAFEKVRRFDSAFGAYRRLAEGYKASPFAAAAVFRLAVNAENAYAFDAAVAGYLNLVDQYASSPDRQAALFNAARLLEALHRRSEAAATLLRYARLFPRAADAEESHFRATALYAQAGDAKEAVAALKAYLQTFDLPGTEPSHLIEARRRLGEASLALQKEAEARAAFEDAAYEFARRGLEPDEAPLAAEAAAKSAFALGELSFAAFDRLKLEGRGKALERSLLAKRKALEEANETYQLVFRYKRLEWTLAALYRRSHGLERFATTLLETPVPPEVQKAGEAAVIEYQALLAEQTVALEEKAVESYAATLAEAKRLKVSNAWTQATREALHRFRPRDYPLERPRREAFLPRRRTPVLPLLEGGAP